MLTEHCIASLGVPLRPPATTVAKHAAVFLHEHQPIRQQRAIFQKSATAANCLAVSATHIFAAQHDNSVVHVYSRETGRQEATVPLRDRISSITLAGNHAILVLGTQEGRIFLWELGTGRLVTTAQAHLQPVTVVAVDATSNFLLSASQDSTIHVWSMPALLSFSRTEAAEPLRTFSSHHADVAALVLGHGASHPNFAVSLATDRTCLVWDYRTNQVLRTYLLAGVPCSAALDPADRALYVGYGDGNVQSIDLYASPTGELAAAQAGKDAAVPVQTSQTSLFNAPDTTYGSALSMSVSYDGSTVITGHHSGNVLNWDVARGQATIIAQMAFHAPVTNLLFLPVTGFQSRESLSRDVRVKEIVKPKVGALNSSETGAVPSNYHMHVQFSSDLSVKGSFFNEALIAPIFPTTLLDEGLSELASWRKNAPQANGDNEANDENFMPLDVPAQSGRTVEQENADLKARLKAMQNVQKKVLEKMAKLSDEKRALLKREEKRSSRKVANGRNGVESDDSSD